MKLIVTTSLFIIGSLFLQAQNCDCKANFLWLKKTFEENDAGYAHIIKNKGESVYQLHNLQTEKKVEKITDYDLCQQELTNWVYFFRKDHFRVITTQKGLQKQKELKTYSPLIEKSIQLKTFKSYLSSKKTDDIEGVWKAGKNTIAVKKIGNDFIGTVIESASTSTFKINEVVFKVNSDLSKGTYYLQNYKPVDTDAIHYFGQNLLQVGNSFFERTFPVYPYSEKTKEYLKLKTDNKPFGYKRDENTVYIHIPSFHQNKKDIDSIFQALNQEITSTPNLILDLRDAQGGQDRNFLAITPYLYTNPVRSVLAEFYSTEKNNQFIKDAASDPDLDEDSKKFYDGMIKKLENNLGKYVNIFSEENVSILKKDKVFPYPKNVGIIIHENNFSTTEEFILTAKQSRKVKFFGRKTGGALDVSNMIETESPTGDFILSYCISRSFRIPENTVDDMGIHPDFYLDKTVPEDEWVDKVTEIMNYWK